MLCSKIRLRTISFILLLTYLVNFYQAYAIPPQKTYEALSSDDSSESSDCYYSDSEGSSDGDTLLHSGEYPEKTSFSNPIPRRKNEKWNHCSSSTEETRIYFGESSESSNSSYSRVYSGSTASPFFRKSPNLSSSSKKHSGSDTSPRSQESQNSSGSSPSEERLCLNPFVFCRSEESSPSSSPLKGRSGPDTSSSYQESQNSSGSSPSEERLCLNPFVFCRSEESSPSSSPLKGRSGPDTSPYSQESPSSSDSSSSEVRSGSDTSPRSQESSNSSSSSSSEGCPCLCPRAVRCDPEHSESSGSLPSEKLHPANLSKFQGPPELLYFLNSTKQNNSPHDCESQKQPIVSSDGKVSSPTTAQNLTPELEERNLVMDYMIENISSHMADRATIARQRIKCYIKDLFSNKSLYNQLSPELLVTVMCYWDRINYVKLIRDTKDEKNELDRFYYTLITLFFLADKHIRDDLRDDTILQKWTWISLIPLTQLNHYRKILLENLNNRLDISQEDYLYYEKILRSCP